LKIRGYCCEFSPNGDSVAVGFEDGSVVIYGINYVLDNVDNIIYGVKTMKEKKSCHNRTKRISALKYSPCGNFLAVGSHERVVDIYNARGTPKMKLISNCKGASGIIKDLNWVEDGLLLEVKTAAREQIFYDISREMGPIATRRELSKTIVPSFSWKTSTGLVDKQELTNCVECKDKEARECLRKESQSKHKKLHCLKIQSSDFRVNSADRCYRNLTATGDILGCVSIFKHLTTSQATRSHSTELHLAPSHHVCCKHYRGHSSYVTNVRWSHDNKYLISTGGRDMAIFVWRLVEP
jgi:microtubule-associated protein-like 6